MHGMDNFKFISIYVYLVFTLRICKRIYLLYKFLRVSSSQDT
jgi:hypothetical protein